MALQNLAKGTLRVAKNYTKGYSDVQAKVREATSNDPWGPSGSQMNEIAQMTYNQNDFVEIMEMLDKRLNDKGKNWRHVFKALTVLDYCLHAGSENVVIYFKDNIYIIKTLKEFQFVDEYDKDQGANVRQKAKDITNLLIDEGRLREARRNRASMRDRMIRGEGGEFDEGEGEFGSRARSRDPPPASRDRRRGTNKEEEDLKKALEASKLSFDKERGGGALTAEERDMMAAIKLSEEEEERRKQEAEKNAAKGLFDEAEPAQQAQQTNPFPLIQFDQGAQNGIMMQPQYTAYNPYAQQQLLQMQQQQQQQQQQEALQAQWIQQQQQQQQQEQWMRAQAEQQQQQMMQDEFVRQQMILQQQQAVQQQQLMEEQQRQQQLYLLQQQQQQQQQQQAQQTNPFSFQQQTQSPQPTPQPQPQSPIQTQPQIQSQPVTRPQRDDGQNAHLASLFANRVDDGVDSFGNIGALRYGHSQAGRLVGQNTGNPFARQQQNGTEQPFFTL